MTKPRGNVRPGQRLEIAAEQINFLNRLMAGRTSISAGPLEGWQFGGNVVLVKNETASVVPRWGVLEVSGILIIPDGGEPLRREFEAMPCVTGQAPSAPSEGFPFVIALEPIQPGKIGKASIAGVTQARFINGGGDVYSKRARPKIGNTSELEAGDEGPAEIISRSGDWGLVRLAGGESGRSACGRTMRYLVRLRADASCGSGFEAIAHVEGDCFGPIASIEIVNGGSGYARLGRIEPSLQITGHGSGATFTPTFTTTTDACGLTLWSIASVSMTGGTGYANGSYLQVTALTGTTTESRAVLAVQDGAVEVVKGGLYYEESPAASPTVFPVTVTIFEFAPSDGTGASFTATVDSYTGSPTFGQIVAVAIDNGGSGYLDRGYSYETTFAGMRFGDLPGYDGSVRQILGHEPNGCLAWFNVEECDPTPAGVCCIEGTVSSDESLSTQAGCEAAGGVWKVDAASDELPGPCCE